MRGWLLSWKQDWVRNKGNIKGRLVTSSYRIAHGFAARKQTHPWLWVLGLPVLISYRLVIEWFLGIELPAKTRVGGGLIIYHGQGLVVNDHTLIGRNVSLRHNTTIGSKVNPDGSQGPSPVIGDGVDVGANAVVLGPISVGEGAVIGAGAVVTKDVPPGSVVVGNPARIIRMADQTHEVR